MNYLLIMSLKFAYEGSLWILLSKLVDNITFILIYWKPIMSLCNCVNIDFRCFHYHFKHQVNNHNFTSMFKKRICNFHYLWSLIQVSSRALTGLIVVLWLLYKKKRYELSFKSVMFVNLNAWYKKLFKC